MKNYLNFETEIKDLEGEMEKLKDTYNQSGLSEVDTQKISKTKKEIDEAANVELKDLKDPEKDSDRAKNPEWLVMVGVCTHLGCVPLGDKGEYKAWFCPCHGSHYDTSGRVRKGPAPKNLEIPKYEFVDSNIIKIG